MSAEVWRYTPNGDGTFTGPPCGGCGDDRYVVDDVPVCLRCDELVDVSAEVAS